MDPSPFLGVILHAIGGLASASFYIPYRKVKHWAWESYWLAGGFFSWIIAPWILALIIIGADVPSIITSSSPKTLFWSYFFGAMWGIGGLTFGLTMRYLGIALGMAVALGYCAAFGTLMPPIFDGSIKEIIHTPSGIMVLVGVAVCLLGIAISGIAGMSKEREMSEEEKKKVIKEFSFFKGILVATFSGIMSASMSYGMAAGKPMAEIALQKGAPDIFQNLPVLIVVLAGGFTTNFIWCVLLNIKNGTGGDYISGFVRKPALPAKAHVAEPAQASVQTAEGARVPLLSNYLFSAIAGTTWYLQFFFYSMGQTKMGKYEFSSWTLHMASIIIFSTLWGVALHEWKGSSKRTHILIAIGLAVLIGSTVIVGYGNYLGAAAVKH